MGKINSVQYFKVNIKWRCTVVPCFLAGLRHSNLQLLPYVVPRGQSTLAWGMKAWPQSTGAHFTWPSQLSLIHLTRPVEEASSYLRTRREKLHWRALDQYWHHSALQRSVGNSTDFCCRERVVMNGTKNISRPDSLNIVPPHWCNNYSMTKLSWP